MVSGVQIVVEPPTEVVSVFPTLQTVLVVANDIGNINHEGLTWFPSVVAWRIAMSTNSIEALILQVLSSTFSRLDWMIFMINDRFDHPSTGTV
jgi:hypothetical protein